MTVKRPPYGETEAPFCVSMARAVLENLEHEPLNQTNYDMLYVELRLACDALQKLLEADPGDPIDIALRRAGIYS